jgi:uncharacterized protein YbjQ (UPF0145 family)
MLASASFLAFDFLHDRKNDSWLLVVFGPFLDLGCVALVVLSPIGLFFSLRDHKKNEQSAIDWEITKQAAAEQEMEERRASEAIILTSGSAHVPGYRVIRQNGFVAASHHHDEDQALFALRVKASKLGANAIISIRVARSRGGHVNVQGDAATIEPTGA